jgi:hypothetical protein
MKHLSLLALAMTFALPVALAPRHAAAAETVTAVAQAVGEADPFVFTWVDGADGKLSVNQQIAGQLHGMFASARYVVTDKGQLILGQLQGQELKPITPTSAVVKNQDGTFFISHVRSQDKTLFMDGTIDRFRSDPTKGFAQFNLTLVAKDGSTISTVVQQFLTFSGSSPAANPPAPAPPAPSPLPFPQQ